MAFVSELVQNTAAFLTYQRNDNHDDPSKFDGRTNDFNFTKYVNAKNVCSHNNCPKYGNPGGIRERVCPKAQHDGCHLNLVGDSEDIIEPCRKLLHVSKFRPKR